MFKERLHTKNHNKPGKGKKGETKRGHAKPNDIKTDDPYNTYDRIAEYKSIRIFKK